MCEAERQYNADVWDHLSQLDLALVVGLTDGGWRRFDLIYLVLDKAEEATDRKLARHLLSLHYERGQNAAQVSAASRLSIAVTPILLCTRLSWHLLQSLPHYHAQHGCN